MKIPFARTPRDKLTDKLIAIFVQQAVSCQKTEVHVRLLGKFPSRSANEGAISDQINPITVSVVAGRLRHQAEYSAGFTCAFRPWPCTLSRRSASRTATERGCRQALAEAQQVALCARQQRLCMSPMEQREEVRLAVAACGNQFTITSLSGAGLPASSMTRLVTPAAISVGMSPPRFSKRHQSGQ
jgi:hypothetical protein